MARSFHILFNTACPILITRPFCLFSSVSPVTADVCCGTDDSQPTRVHRIDPSQFMLPRNDSYQYTSSPLGSHEVRSLPHSPENNLQSNGLRLHDAYTTSTAPPHTRCAEISWFIMLMFFRSRTDRYVTYHCYSSCSCWCWCCSFCCCCFCC